MNVEPVGDAVCQLGESPLWHAGALWWIDLLDPALHVLRDGVARRLVLSNPPPLGFVAATDREGHLLLGHRGGVSLLDTASGVQSALCDPEDGRFEISTNDGRVAPDGSLWFGTSDVLEMEPRGALYRFPPRSADMAGPGSERAARLVDAGFAVTNGPAFSPDGATAYVSDTVGRRILAYAIDSRGGRARSRRVFARMASDDGLPDGLCIDAAGAVWCAHWDGWRLTRYSPDGERLAIVPLPVPRPTAIAFAEADLRTLIVTTAIDGLDAPTRAASPCSGRLLRLRTDNPGIATVPFQLGCH